MDINERIVRVIRKGKVAKTLPKRAGYKIVHGAGGIPSYVKMSPDEMRTVKKAIKKTTRTKKRKNQKTLKRRMKKALKKRDSFNL